MPAPPVALLARDLAHLLSPWQLFRDGWKVEPHPAQKVILDFPSWKDAEGNTTRECNCLGHRQGTGKSTVGATLATAFAKYSDAYLGRVIDDPAAIIIAPAEAQAQKTLTKAKRVFERGTGSKAREIKVPLVADSKRSLELPHTNGATIAAYGGHSPDTIVGATAVMILYEEADRIPPETVAQTDPFVSATGGYVLRITQPKKGNRNGLFARAWRSGTGQNVRDGWTPASHVPRSEVDKYIRTHGPEKAATEYLLMPPGEEWGKGATVDPKRPKPFEGFIIEEHVDKDQGTLMTWGAPP